MLSLRSRSLGHQAILLTERLVTHALTPHLQHEMPELNMMFGRVKHIKRLLQMISATHEL